MAGYVKVSNAAFRFRKMTQRHVAIRLYELGDEWGWKVFPCSDSYLMDDGPSKRDVRHVLSVLEAKGLIEVVTTGDRQNTRTIRVIDPAPKEPEKADQDANQDADQDADHENNGQAEPIEKSGPGREPGREPELGLKNQTTDKTTDSDPKINIPAIAKRYHAGRADWETVHAAYRDARFAIDPGATVRALKRSKGLGKLLTTRTRDHGAEAVARVLKWWGSSPHPRAVYLRSGGYGVDTLMSAKKFETYLNFADSKPPTAPPKRGQWLDAADREVDTDNLVVPEAF